MRRSEEGISGGPDEAAEIDDLYERYRHDPASVAPEWAYFFAGFELGRRAEDGSGARAARPATLPVHAAAAVGPPSPVAGVFDIIHSYRELGHLTANLDPLGNNATSHPLLELGQFGFTEADLDRRVDCPSFLGCESASIRELVEMLRATYCRTVAVEYMFISNKDHREWIQQRIEPSFNTPELTPEERRRVLTRITRASVFERFLHTKYVGQKRFSLEGAEALVPLLDTLVEESADLGVREIVMGMPHRGRLNVLAHTLRKPYEMLLSEFEGSFLPESVQGDGDVKYHLGYSNDYTSRKGGDVHLSLLFNPSHLEAIDPVAEGIVAGKQHYRGDTDGSRVMPVLMHGDAAFMGQGVVMETLALSELPAYKTGGTIHVIINNQVGFTTSPVDYRFTRYPTEIAKLIQAPVLHVNADDPEAAVQAARLAAGFRARFKEDVLIDLVCYRRHGHNEVDDPTFTQPLMYKTIAAKRPVHEIYRERLVAEGVITAEDAQAEEQRLRQELEQALDYARDFMPKQQVFTFGGAWKGMTYAGDAWSADTRLSRNALERVMKRATEAPAGFALHPKLKKLMEERRTMLEGDGSVDWACGEMLAIGTLLLEGTTVRLSGQDSGRGTFSQRHAAVHDMNTNERHVPLDNMTQDQGRFYLVDSCLSEAGVLGFEYGFSSADPRNLVLWEAQFGDFANSAQVIIDQFIASAESKWQRMSGIVLLLPHGYEGQGPEHSSARLERFLNMCAEQNMQVCTPTTPAQYFHLLRRQMHRNFRKPLIVMTPKSMLRHKLCRSTVGEFTDGVFQPVIADGDGLDDSKVRRVLLCAGKVYYDLFVARGERNIHDVAIVRIDQLYPFPLEQLRETLHRYPDSAEIYWVQEEPKNMGPWRFVNDRSHMIFDDDRGFTYVGRDSASSPATGSYKIHQAELAQLLDEALRPRRVERLRSTHAG